MRKIIGESCYFLMRLMLESAPEIRPIVIKGMSEVLAEMMGPEQAEIMGFGPVHEILLVKDDGLVSKDNLESMVA